MSETENTVDKEVGEILGAAFAAAAENKPDSAAALKKTLRKYGEEKIEAAKEILSEVYQAQKRTDPYEAAQTLREFSMICQAAEEPLGCLGRQEVFGPAPRKEPEWCDIMRNVMLERGRGHGRT